MASSTILLLTLTLAVGHSSPSSTQWNQFRGPNGSGVAESSNPPVKINADNLAWRVAVPPGHSSPVLSADRIFLTAIENDRLVTLALDKVSGQIVWRQEAPDVPVERTHEASSPAASTPYVDESHVYVYFGSYGLLCYDHDGREQWRIAIPTPKNPYGMATSPIGHATYVIVVLDNDANLEGGELSQSKVIAVDKRTGDLAWETARPLNRSSWSTPMIWDHGDDQDLVVMGNGRLFGYDPSTGEEKWYVNGFPRETIAVPVSGGEQLYVSAARLGGDGDAQPDPVPFWNALLQFDRDGDNRIQRSEMTGFFTFPLRPELPVEHPGFGIPLPKDEGRRQERLDGMLTWVDKDEDGFWTKEEFIRNMSFRRGKPVLMAIRPEGKGDITDSNLSWQVHRGIPEIPSPIYYENRLFLVRKGGLVSALDTANGKILYRQRLGATGQYNASPVVANDHLYLISDQGLVSVVKPDNEFRLVHQHDLHDHVFATPALDASTIYIRTESGLLAFRK